MFRYLISCLPVLLASLMSFAQENSSTLVYFGTYTGKGSEGIYVASLDTNGTLGSPRLAAKVTNPSFLAIHPTKKWLYAVSEVETTEGKKGGGVTAFSINPDTGTLTKINSQLTHGGAPCHVSIDRKGNCVLLANYSGGSVCSVPINADGSLGNTFTTIQHTGKSINKERQEASHAHSINPSPDNRFALAADLGTDEIHIYRLNSGSGTITLHANAKTPAGGGPRHLTYHPNGKFVYVNNELTSSVTCFRYDSDKGELSELATSSTLPVDFKGNNTTAEIKTHPNGRFIYVSNRGHDSIAVFRINEDGTLTPTSHTKTGGRTPRNFNFVGKFLLAANQDTGNIVVFAVDEKSGALSPAGSSINVSMPVCVLGK